MTAANISEQTLLYLCLFLLTKLSKKTEHLYVFGFNYIEVVMRMEL